MREAGEEERQLPVRASDPGAEAHGAGLQGQGRDHYPQSLKTFSRGEESPGFFVIQWFTIHR